jgi:DNA-binding NtrC family response regulator
MDMELPEKDKGAILVVDDHEGMRLFLREAIIRDGHRVACAASATEALERLQEEDFQVIVLDIKMPGMNGWEALGRMRRLCPEAMVIIITAYGDERLDIGELGNQIFSCLTKPFDLEEFRLVLKKAMQAYRSGCGKERLSLRSLGTKEIVGSSPQIVQVRKLIEDVSGSEVTVLIYGESGTGKELVARAIHLCSARRQRDFVVVNCSAIPETLLESELFGYEKGAFTGAEAIKRGKFELAHKGSLFLDEIGDMSLGLQAKILRAIEEKEIERLGAIETLKVDVRIIAATNKDLIQEVKRRRFREDLYYRLNVVPIKIPPLRERKQDIPLLVDYLIQRFNQQLNRQIKEISVEALEALISYSWPGNVRELENVLQRAMVLAKGTILDKEDLSVPTEEDFHFEELEGTLSLGQAVRDAVSQIEKRMIRQALAKHKMNRTQAARELKISRKSLFNKMRQYGIS